MSKMVEIKYVEGHLLVNPKIALVGSSDLLLKSGYGVEIDIFPEVVRFNRAPTIGHEHDVGSKTTIRVANNHVFDGVKLDSSQWPNQPSDFIKNLRNTKICYLGPDMTPWLDRKKKAHDSCSLFRFKYEKMTELKKICGYDQKKNFSVGTTFACLCVISGVVPHLYGFDVEDRYRGHYFEARPPAGPIHNIIQEKNLLKKMNEEGLIIVK